MLSVVLLSIIMLGVIMLGSSFIIIVCVNSQYAECRYAECLHVNVIVPPSSTKIYTKTPFTIVAYLYTNKLMCLSQYNTFVYDQHYKTY